MPSARQWPNVEPRSRPADPSRASAFIPARNLTSPRRLAPARFSRPSKSPTAILRTSDSAVPGAVAPDSTRDVVTSPPHGRPLPRPLWLTLTLLPVCRLVSMLVLLSGYTSAFKPLREISMDDLVLQKPAVGRRRPAY
jgi:hypothetical protein